MPLPVPGATAATRSPLPPRSPDPPLIVELGPLASDAASSPLACPSLAREALSPTRGADAFDAATGGEADGAEADSTERDGVVADGTGADSIARELDRGGDDLAGVRSRAPARGDGVMGGLDAASPPGPSSRPA